MDRSTIRIDVTDGALDVLAEQAELLGRDGATGAMVTFIGLMRDVNDGDSVAAMRLEHYPGMTEKALNEIAGQAGARWDLQAIRIVHRVGELRPTEPIVFVAVSSAHRGAAFEACEFLMDYLKTRAPFWKQETLQDGRHRWVEARDKDTAAAERWSDPNSAR